MIVPTVGTAALGLARSGVPWPSTDEVFVNLPYDIFSGRADTTVFILTKRSTAVPWPPTGSHKVRVRTFPKRYRIKDARDIEEDQEQVNFCDWFSTGTDEYLTYANTRGTALINKLQAVGRPLSDFADVQRGVTPFHLTDSPQYKSSKPAFEGTVRRYQFERGPKKFVRFDNTLAEPKPERYFSGPRLLLRELISRQFQLQAARVHEDFVTNKSMQSVLALGELPNLNFLLGCINSKLMSWYFLHRSNIAQRDDFPKIVLKETRNLPIAQVKGTSAVTKHNKLADLVIRMLELQECAKNSNTERERTVIDRQIEAVDRQIDQLVYELYELTEEEIAIVESAMERPSPVQASFTVA